MNLHIHNRCNQNCIFCNTQRYLIDGTWQETSHDDIIKQIDEMTGDTINFTGGGEVTMLKRLPEYVGYAKSKGFINIYLETNGCIFVYEEFVKKLKERGVTGVFISLHSHTAKVSDEITQKKGSFEYTIEGMKNLQKNGIQIKAIYHTITTKNYHHLKEFIQTMSTDFDIDTYMLSFIRPHDTTAINREFTPRLSEIKGELQKALDYAKTKGITISFSLSLGVPVCFLGEYKNASVEKDFYMKNDRKTFENATYAFEKKKDPKCIECEYFECCSGLTLNYTKMYGTDELVPIKKK